MPEEKVLQSATICYPIRGNKVLMAVKTRKIGAGKWNGYGGGIEEGETPRKNAVNELRQESGLVTREEDLEKAAIVDFHNTMSDGRKFTCRCHVFLVRRFTGEPRETEEMARPTWFPVDALPDNMMPADKIWLPAVLHGKKVIASAHLGPFQQELLDEVKVQEVYELPED